jgi:GntR family transcriptional regulator, galactonate operon transcriptional repressor
MTNSLESSTLIERVVGQLGAMIVRGDIAEGATIPVEEDASRHFGVGRNVLREAVKILVGKGMLEPRRRHGTFVTSRTDWNALDPAVLGWMLLDDDRRRELLDAISELRMMIEPEVAALAARKADTAGVARLHDAWLVMERDAPFEQAALRSDIAFHKTLFALADNHLVTSLLPAFEVALWSNFRTAIKRPGSFIRNLQEHRLVAEAVAARDPVAARTAMVTLLQNNERDLAQVIRSPGASR